jgi:Flp pilus assembly protein TadD
MLDVARWGLLSSINPIDCAKFVLKSILDRAPASVSPMKQMVYASAIERCAHSGRKCNLGLSVHFYGTSRLRRAIGFESELMSSNPKLRIYYPLALVLASLGFRPTIGSAQELQVSVRERSGEPLSREAFVHVTAQAGGQTMVATTGNARTAASTASFQLGPGEFDIEVEAAGYNRGTEHATISTSKLMQTVYVYLTPVGSSIVATPASGVAVSPNVQRELDKSLALLRQGKYGEARRHLEKAHKMAPSSPDILYLMGILEYTAKDMPAARQRFESLLATYPAHERSLLMLGQMQLEANENKDAGATLQRAVEADASSWRAHYLLALAFVRTGELSKAEVEATRAGDLNQEKAAAMRLLGAKILLIQGKDSEAEHALQSFMKDYPKDDAIPEAKKYVEKIEEAKKSAAVAAISLPDSLKPSEAESAVAVAATLEKPWAPADIDARTPPTAPGVSCSLEDVLNNTQQRILKQLGDLEKFSATERVEHQVLDVTGVWTNPVSQDFDYLIFVHHTPTLPYYFDEDRNGGESLYSFPSSLATRGLVSLGFMVIHPVFSKDFEFTCEGLGTWNGKPAWQLLFVQRPDVPSRIRSWSYKKTIYPIPLKGRVWVGANNYTILHLETTLREPVPGLRLNREQLIVDYGPVHFQSTTTELWLPWQAEMYFDMMGRRYHHKHMLTNYLLFDVDTKNKIKVPSVPPDLAN